MSKELGLLEASVEHWKRLLCLSFEEILDLGDTDWGERETLYSKSCPLCLEFLHRDEIEVCKDCPIALAVNDNRCQGTPWAEAASAWEDLVYSVEENNSKSEDQLLDDWRSKAKLELEFLQELLETERSKHEARD
jgi:hypothetical protein